MAGDSNAQFRWGEFRFRRRNFSLTNKKDLPRRIVPRSCRRKSPRSPLQVGRSETTPIDEYSLLGERVKCSVMRAAGEGTLRHSSGSAPIAAHRGAQKAFCRGAARPHRHFESRWRRKDDLTAFKGFTSPTFPGYSAVFDSVFGGI